MTEKLRAKMSELLDKHVQIIWHNHLRQTDEATVLAIDQGLGFIKVEYIHTGTYLQSKTVHKLAWCALGDISEIIVME